MVQLYMYAWTRANLRLVFYAICMDSVRVYAISESILVDLIPVETFTESLGQRSTGSTYYLRVDDRFAYSDAWVARIQRQQKQKSEPGPMPSAYYNVEPNGHSAYYNVGPNGHGAHYNDEPNGQGAYYNVEPNGPIAYYNVEPDWRNARVSPHTLQPRPYRESVHIRKKRSNEKSARLPHHLHSKATTSSSPRSNYRKTNSLSQSREVDDDDDETSESDVDEHNVHVELVSDI